MNQEIFHAGDQAEILRSYRPEQRQVEDYVAILHLKFNESIIKVLLLIDQTTDNY